MAATSQKTTVKVEDDHETLFLTYPCTSAYYVESPSATSQANSSDSRNPGNRHRETPASRFTPSGYSSSMCSSNSFLHDKKMNYDPPFHGVKKTGNRLVIIGGEGDDDNDGGGGEDGGRKSGVWRFLSLDPSSSWCCIGFQLCWRFMVSFGVALLVFYLATRPSIPNISLEVAGIKEFELVEGIDVTDVATKVLTCNYSMEIKIENHSKVFGLHLHPPTIEIFFDRLKIASSQNVDEEYVKVGSWLVRHMYIGTKGRPVYGAGSVMEDMLDSGHGLSLLVRARFMSSYRVVGDLVRPRFRHNTECDVVITRDVYNDQHNSVAFNSTCFTTSHHT